MAKPDHGSLRPWRTMSLDRTALAEVFEQALRERNPMATDADVERERDKATNAPTQLALIGRIEASHPAIPAHEQWIAIGTALQSMLLAVEALGFGAKILSGDRCAEPRILGSLGLASGESLIGFISIDTILEAPRPRADPTADHVLTSWPG